MIGDAPTTTTVTVWTTSAEPMETTDPFTETQSDTGSSVESTEQAVRKAQVTASLPPPSSGNVTIMVIVTTSASVLLLVAILVLILLCWASRR